MQVAAGDRVTVRGDSWIVDEATSFGDCALLSLSSADRFAKPRTCKLLLPFDRPLPSAGIARVRAVTRRRWMHHFRAAVSELRIFGQLRAAAHASIDILPFQLEPALAMITGRASRFLLADEVGLGKTVQAGLMLAELQQRGWCDRALILTPSGLRRQWAEELQRRFDIRAAVMDAAALSAIASSLPSDLNPWIAEPVSIASIDFVKQPEVLRGLCSHVWDIVIVDEAHQASAASLRYEAVKAVAGRAREVVLLTATPHAGDDAAYRALCELGRLDRGDPILLFRRTREQVGLSRTRRVHLLPIALSPEAAAMHRMLSDYVQRLWRIAQNTGSRDIQLVAMVLNKRAFSSACSLAISIERRLAALSGFPPRPSQSPLPLDGDTDAADDAPPLVAPAFDRPAEEDATLRQLLEIATRTSTDDPKMRVLRRLLRRVQEPVIVFTEYRDTLEALASAVGDLRKLATLHGGHTPHERRNAVDAFTSGAADLLLATDAGAEGLNLQSRCRVVVNLELPWNPIRLEQRIGRVDRIGQTRAVHAINFFADATAESIVLARLHRRMERIQASEIDIAASVINRAPLPAKTTSALHIGCTESVDLSEAARAEAARIAVSRRLVRTPLLLEKNIIPVTTIGSRRLQCADGKSGPSVVCLIRIRIATRAGRLVEDTLVPVRFPFEDPRCKGPRRDVRSFAEEMLYASRDTVVDFVSRFADERAAAIARESEEWVTRSLLREHHLAVTGGTDAVAMVQPGLFDNRALKDQQMADQQYRSAFDESVDRRAVVAAATTASLSHGTEITLVLLTC